MQSTSWHLICEIDGGARASSCGENLERLVPSLIPRLEFHEGRCLLFALLDVLLGCCQLWDAKIQVRNLPLVVRFVEELHGRELVGGLDSDLAYVAIGVLAPHHRCAELTTLGP